MSLTSVFAALFVLLWSTGFIGAKYGLPYIEPLTFLTIRFALVLALFAFCLALFRMEWPKRSIWPNLIWIGILNHGAYTGGVFVTISWGVPAGIVALIVSLGPIFTALLSKWRFGERLTSMQWLGMALGVLGVSFVVWRKLDSDIGSLWGVVLPLISAFCFALGAIEQRRLGKVPMTSGNTIQYIGALIVVLPGYLFLETGTVIWSDDLLFAFFWLIFVLSIGAISLYYYLLRWGLASETASLLFLTPAFTALIAWLLFDEQFGWMEVIGFAIAVLGVAMVTKKLFAKTAPNG